MLLIEQRANLKAGVAGISPHGARLKSFMMPDHA